MPKYVKPSREENERHMKDAREKTFTVVQKALLKKGVTLCKVATRLREALDAEEVVTKFDGGQFGSQRFLYSKRLVAHNIRLSAAKLAAELLDMMPAEKIDVTVNETLADQIREARERRKNAGKHAKG
jgi:hypothetical protein